MKELIISFTLIVSALSAPKPSGCIESCLSQRLASLRAASSNLDYGRAGNWTEHNQYITDGGHGKVHEEHGQYMDSSKQLRYFKKNYSSSFGSSDALSSGLARDLFGNYNSERLSSSTGSVFRGQFLEAAHHPEVLIDNMKKLITSSQSAYGHHSAASSRLEDFGHAENTLDQSHLILKPKTEGQEKVFEEQGKVQHGPTHIRYYKKNYTSNYSSVIPVAATGFIHNQHADSFGKDVEATHYDNYNNRGENHHHQVAENSQYQANYGHRQSDYGSAHEAQQIATNHPRVPVYGAQVSEHLTAYESKKVHEVPLLSSHQSYRGSYGSATDQVGVGSVYGKIQSNSQSYSGVDESALKQHPEQSQYHQNYDSARITAEESSRGDIAGSNVNEKHHQSGYQSAAEAIPVSSQGQIRKYEEHHSHSSHYKQSTIPHHYGGSSEALQNQQTANGGHYSASGYAQQSGYSQHSSYYGQARNTHVDSNGQIFGAPTGKLMVGHVHNADCTHEQTAGHAQYSQYRPS